MNELDAFSRLAAESQRTDFMFYGYRMAEDGRIGPPYFKLAHSLSEALADLKGNPGVASDVYFIEDAFVTLDEDGMPTVHVQLVPGDDLAHRYAEEEQNEP
jgi:hypothetical protein